MTVTLIKYPAPLLNKIGSYVCQAVIYIQQQQPELLLDKYRNVSWRDNNNQSRLKVKLVEVIANTQNWESLINQVEVFIQSLLIPDSTNTPVLIKLQEKIRHLEPKTLDSETANNQQDTKSIKTISEASETQKDINSTESTQQESLPTKTISETSESQQDINSIESTQEESLSTKTNLQTSENQPNRDDYNNKTEEQVRIKENQPITALLLDAEKIPLTPESEQFLTKFCTNPIQIKIAFANWQSMGEKDTEFYDRGYDLIHVPHGKDNADGKMIAFGSTIDEYYPKVKEILVCSSDNVMTNLCEDLQHKGLTIFQVSQHLSNLTILNSKTQETQNHTILPSIEKLLSQIKEIIEEQERQTSNQWIKLSKICKLFKEKHSFGVNKVVSHHLPGKNIKNIFVHKPEFVIHQIPEQPEIYITLFKMPIQEDVQQKESINIQE
ncbi:MAG: NYN domain-containing protein [Cyanobacteria bacterium P01_A01_bin.68]